MCYLQLDQNADSMKAAEIPTWWALPRWRFSKPSGFMEGNMKRCMPSTILRARLSVSWCSHSHSARPSSNCLQRSVRDTFLDSRSARMPDYHRPSLC